MRAAVQAIHSSCGSMKPVEAEHRIMTAVQHVCVMKPTEHLAEQSNMTAVCNGSVRHGEEAVGDHQLVAKLVVVLVEFLQSNHDKTRRIENVICVPAWLADTISGSADYAKLLP